MIPAREALQTIYNTTVSEIQPMTTKQRVGVGLANTASFSRIAIAAPLLSKPDLEPWNWTNALEAAAIPASDCADGALARAFKARTTAGGYLDQAIDKALFVALEAKLVARGEMDAEDFAARVDSDQDITSERTRITVASNGEVNVDALAPGKYAAALRFVEKTVSMSPVAERAPRAVRMLQRYVTKTLVTTRQQSKTVYRERYAEWLKSQPQSVIH